MALALGLPPLTRYSVSQGWVPEVPSFLFETTWFMAFATTVIFVYLYKPRQPSFFVQLYLLSMAVKLVAFFAYNLIMVLDDRGGAVANVLYFLSVYFLFTAVEIGFLYKRISRLPGA
ncbi:MAG: hypothetical protein WA874_15950 [Chryseosolibacter sp.]